MTYYGDIPTLIGDLDHMTKPNLMANIALVLERLNPGTQITDITGTAEAVRFMHLQSVNILWGMNIEKKIKDLRLDPVL